MKILRMKGRGGKNSETAKANINILFMPFILLEPYTFRQIFTQEI